MDLDNGEDDVELAGTKADNMSGRIHFRNNLQTKENDIGGTSASMIEQQHLERYKKVIELAHQSAH